MKINKLILFLIVLCCVRFQSFCQITIDKTDMPAGGDTFRISVINNLHGINPATTGQNVNWNFSQLTPNTQTVDTFFNILSTQYIPITYNLIYNNPLDQAHKADVVTRSFNSNNPFPQVQITENFNFYKSSSSGYSQVGQGAKVNGIPTAMKYDNAESFFKFPMLFGNTDSTVSKYGIAIPSLGYYGQTIKRVNLVDGYGSLTTPYGTFNVMRVKSLITTVDTIYLDTLHFGTHLNRPLETQYIWLGDNQGDPLLFISKTNNTTTVRYKDSITTSYVAINDIFNNQGFSFFPNPATNILKITSDEIIGRVEISNLLGEAVLLQENSFSDINISNLKKGIYIVRIYNKNGALLSARKFVKE